MKNNILPPLAEGRIKGFPNTGKPCEQQHWQSATLAEYLTGDTQKNVTKAMRKLPHVPGFNDDTPEFSAANEKYLAAKLEQKSMLRQDSIDEQKRRIDRVRKLAQDVKKCPKKMWNKWSNFAWEFVQWFVETYLAHYDSRKRDQPLPENDQWYNGKNLPYPDTATAGANPLGTAMDSSAASSSGYSISAAETRSKRLANEFQLRFGSLLVEFRKAQQDGWKPLDMGTAKKKKQQRQQNKKAAATIVTAGSTATAAAATTGEGELATSKASLRTKPSAKVIPVKFSPKNKRQRGKERTNLNGQYNQESSCNSHISYILFTHACSHVHAAPTLFD